MDSYAHPAPVRESATQKCPRCDYTWDVLGLHEYGHWTPYDDNDLICPDCGCKIISAGFVRPDAMGRFICYGESESLGIKSRPEDSDLANRMFGR